MYIHKQKDLHFLMPVHILSSVLTADLKPNCIAEKRLFSLSPVCCRLY